MFLLKNVIVSVLAVRSMLAICQVEKSARSRLMLRKWLSMRGLLGNSFQQSQDGDTHNVRIDVPRLG